jgi:Dolichyl-phosphate-mannose-protein mannosyltransferase
MDDEGTRRRNRGLFLLILSSAAFLRLLHIDQPFEDVVSWRQADDATIADNFFRGHLNIFLPEISWNGPGPSYVGYEFQLITYLAALLYHLFGEEDWVGRGISVCFGVWGVFAFRCLVRRAFNEVQALVSSAVLAVMPNGIFVDRSFLPDPAMVSLVITSLWMLLVYLQDRRINYLWWSTGIGTLGLLTKISGLIVGFPVVYMILSLLPGEGGIRLRHLIRLMTASTVMLTPVIGYYVWAIHVSHAYPPYHVAAANNWVWDAGFGTWLKAGYFLPSVTSIAKLLWGVPLLVSAFVGLLFPPAKGGTTTLRWLFHFWLLGGFIFYAFGARELWVNIWNFHIVDPALAGLAAQGLLVTGSALASQRLPLLGRAAVILVIAATHGLEMSHLGWVYLPHARHGYELGAALARISRPSDLVVTVANSIGDPVAIYYSRRRGWVFPPPWPGVDWENIPDEPAAIKLFDRLRRDGAKWFGIVAVQRTNFRETYPQLLAHIESTAESIDDHPDWTIYRIAPSLKEGSGPSHSFQE